MLEIDVLRSKEKGDTRRERRRDGGRREGKQGNVREVAGVGAAAGKKELNGAVRLKTRMDEYKDSIVEVGGSAPALVVSGGGGAFLHPTHLHPPRLHAGPSSQTPYRQAGVYPSASISKRYSLLNILGFRNRNWHFDLVGGSISFALVYNSLPLCEPTLRGILNAKSWTERIVR